MQNNKNLRALIALSIIPGFGARRTLKLIKNNEDIGNLFKLGKTKLKTTEGIGEASALSILTFDRWNDVDEIIHKSQEMGAQIISFTDPEYPPLLKQIYDPPPVFWLKGNAEALSKPGVAVVGTRNPSAYGRKMTAEICAQLVNQGLCIFSGLAYGIDSIAHQTAVEMKGTTVAVLGSGIDNLYPAKNSGLAKQIIETGGAVISEFPLGTKPDAGNFPVRNRIVSGLSLGILVTESGIQGGSMITADMGLDQNREIFAFPHPLTNPSGTGCNYLIKRGNAKLIQTADDILEELPIEHTTQATRKKPAEPKKNWRIAKLDELGSRICEKLEEKSMQVDDLAETLHMDTSRLLVALLQLEMEELIVQKAGKIFDLR